MTRSSRSRAAHATPFPRDFLDQTTPGRRATAITGVRCGAALLASGALLVAAGCYGPMYSAPYGYPTSPGQPGGQYYPGGTVVPGGTILGPGSQTYDTPAPTGTSGGDAPPFGSGSGGGATNRPVPDYNDDGRYYPTGSGAASGSGAAPDRVGNWPVDPGTGNSGSSSPPAGGNAPANDEFLEPTTPDINPISHSRDVTSVNSIPFGHEARYSWLQGVVSYDPRDRSWGIVYDASPDERDAHAGYLTLSPDPRFNALQDGSVVRVHGQVDPVVKDQFGRATYVVSKIAPVGG